MIYHTRHGFQVEIGVGAGQALDGDAAHRDFFHQLLVVGIQGVKIDDHNVDQFFVYAYIEAGDEGVAVHEEDIKFIF